MARFGGVVLCALAIACGADPVGPSADTDAPSPPIPCDGAGYVSIWVDLDGDGVRGTEQQVCDPPPGAFLSPGDEDCDDEDPLAYPGAWDAPNDGVDRDCDGADESYVFCGHASRHYEGSLFVDSLDDLDDFCFDYNGVTGDVVITGDIPDISGLFCLCEVGGDLRIEDTTKLDWIAALDTLWMVGGDLRITGNAALVDASWMYTHVGGDTEIADNPVLEYPPIFDSFSGRLTIKHNPMLRYLPQVFGTRLDGFEFVDNDSVTRLWSDFLFPQPFGSSVLVVEGDVVITDNASLTTLDALEILAQVYGDLVVERNDALQALEWNVAMIEGDFIVRDNPKLEDFAVEINFIYGDLAFERNHGLDYLALFNLREVGGDVSFVDNALLIGIGNHNGFDLAIQGSLLVEGNGVGLLAARQIGLASRTVEIGGDVVFRNSIFSADGTNHFPLLTEIGGDLILEGPHAPGVYFEALTTVPGTVRLAQTISHPVGTTFDALATVGGSLEIVDNPGSSKIEFPALTSLGGDLTLAANPALDQLDLGSLAEVPGDVDILSCDALEDLSFAAGLRATGDLRIATNAQLTDVTALHDLESVGNLTIQENPLLGDAAATALAEAIDTVGGVVWIEGNGP